jgi:hypothetical protein
MEMDRLVSAKLISADSPQVIFGHTSFVLNCRDFSKAFNASKFTSHLAYAAGQSAHSAFARRIIDIRARLQKSAA